MGMLELGQLAIGIVGCEREGEAAFEWFTDGICCWDDGMGEENEGRADE